MGVKCLGPMRKGWGYSDLFYYKSPGLVGLVVKALEGREERQGLDLRRWGDDRTVCMCTYSQNYRFRSTIGLSSCVKHVTVYFKTWKVTYHQS